MHEKLKPCPRCNSSDIEVAERKFLNIPSDFWPLCMACKLQGPVFIDREIAVEWWNTRHNDTEDLLTIAYMSGQSDEAARHRETKQALFALLHYIDHGGVFPDGWNWDKVREVAK